MNVTGYNVNHLFAEGLWKFKTCGVRQQSRNGPVISITEPTTSCILRPDERVLFHPERDANPIFHLMEAIWMLAGRRDVAFLEQFNSKIGQYSDDGVVFNAAYGHRMRHHFGLDQLSETIGVLQAGSETRQAVIQLWDPADLTKNTLDKACNTQLMFRVFGDVLEMTVINRSNDFWYGQAGANAVHFSMIQEFISSACGLQLGPMWTLSNNLHLYTELYSATKFVDSPPGPEGYDFYEIADINPTPIMPDGNWKQWLKDAEQFCECPSDARIYSSEWFNLVAKPMARVQYDRKKSVKSGFSAASDVAAEDWKLATIQWLERRVK